MTRLEKKSLDRPDTKVAFEGVTADVVQVGDSTISRNVYQPGTHCALGGRRMAGNHRAEQSCQAHHSGVALQGQLRVEMDDGSVLNIGPNEVFDVPPGHDGWVTGDNPFVGITWSGVRSWLPEDESADRVVSTVLFTDIVDSTETALRLGDQEWRALLDRHNREVRAQLDRFRGREITTTGDGFLAIFDGAGRALMAAREVLRATAQLGLQVRAGVHTGEVELVGDDVRGASVHEAARIAGAAGPAQVLVSETTRLLAGDGFVFEESRGHELKGFEGARTLYALAD